MRFLLSTASMGHLEPETAFWVAHYARFDGVELVIDRAVAEAGLERIRKYAEQYRMPVESLRVPPKPIEDWGGYWQNVRRSLDWAGALGTGILVLHPDPSLRGLWRRGAIYARRLRGLRAAAAEKGITVALENLARFRNPWRRLKFNLGRLERVVELARRAGMQLAFNTAHLASWGRGVVSAFERTRELVALIHLSDFADGRTHLLPGQGYLPLDEMLVVVRREGFAGPVVLDARPPAVEFGQADEVLAPLIRVRKWLKRRLKTPSLKPPDRDG